MKTNIPLIYILILNWNGKEDTIECLESVHKIDYPNYKTVVMDNGSSDDSVAVFQENFPQVHVIENGANLGFAAGNNVGIDYALSEGADYVFLLNNDTVVDPQILWAFMNAAEKYPNAGMFGSKIYFYGEPEKIWYAGGQWLPDAAKFTHVGWGVVDDGTSWEEIKQTDYICGCSLLVKAEVIKKIGTMEPRYFLTYEESDWCYRAKRAGYQCFLVPGSKVWHKISSSFSGGDGAPHQEYFFSRNRLLWIERNTTFIEAIKLYKLIFIQTYGLLRSYFSFKITARERLKKKAALQGVKDYIFRKFGNCPSWVISQSKQ